MKAREKSSKTFSSFLEFNSRFSCEKHPFSSSSSSTVGICPHCLSDRLMRLVCSDCGERRVSSCSCSEIFEIHRNSCSIADVGSFGRISFLIDNDYEAAHKRRSFVLRRSSSNCAGVVEKSSGFSRIKRLFVKKRNYKERAQNLEFCDEARKSGFGDVLDYENEMEFDRFCSGSVFPVKERDLRGMDESGFIDLKLDSSSYEFKHEFRGGRSSRASDHGVGCRNENFEASLQRNGMCGNGGSCRITMNERGLKQRSRSYNVWKRIFNNGKKKV